MKYFMVKTNNQEHHVKGQNMQDALNNFLSEKDVSNCSIRILEAEMKEITCVHCKNKFIHEIYTEKDSFSIRCCYCHKTISICFDLVKYLYEDIPYED